MNAHCFCLLLLSIVHVSIAQNFGVTFSHGVASGDFTDSTIILWTRVSPTVATTASAVAHVEWRVCSDSLCAVPLKRGCLRTDAARDWSVKTEVIGLTPRVKYYYRFICGSVRSAVGTFKLPPPKGVALSQLRYATFSCANYGWGHYNAYDFAQKYQLDFAVLLGDYIYENTYTEFPQPEQRVRSDIVPRKELTTLNDYRTHYRQVNSKAQPQNLRRKVPLLVMWDDHEFADGAYVSGADGHDSQDDGTTWTLRVYNALKAMHEHQPTRRILLCSIAVGIASQCPANDLTGQSRESRMFTQAISSQCATPPIDVVSSIRILHMGNLASMMLLETRLSTRTKTNFDIAGLISLNPSKSIVAMAYLLGKKPSDYNRFPYKQLWEELAEEIDEDASKNTNRMIGDFQLNMLRKMLQDSRAANIPWQLIGSGQQVNDFRFNFQAAIAKRKLENPTQGAEWDSAWRTVTDCNDGATYRIRSRLTAFDAFRAAPQPLPNNIVVAQNLLLENSLATSTILKTVCPVSRGLAAAGMFHIDTYLDSWTGYKWERAQMLAIIAAEARGAVFYFGDTHYSAAEEVMYSSRRVAASFGGASVTSPKLDLLTPQFDDNMWAAAVKAGAPTNKYFNSDRRGFILHTLTAQKHHSEFLFVSSVTSPTYSPICGAAFDYTPATGYVPLAHCGAFPLEVGVVADTQAERVDEESPRPAGCVRERTSSPPHAVFTLDHFVPHGCMDMQFFRYAAAVAADVCPEQIEVFNVTGTANSTLTFFGIKDLTEEEEMAAFRRMKERCADTFGGAFCESLAEVESLRGHERHSAAQRTNATAAAVCAGCYAYRTWIVGLTVAGAVFAVAIATALVAIRRRLSRVATPAVVVIAEGKAVPEFLMQAVPPAFSYPQSVV